MGSAFWRRDRERPPANASQPELLALLPDVEIFHKAVASALNYDEFFDPGEIAGATKLLGRGGSARGNCGTAARVDRCDRPGGPRLSFTDRRLGDSPNGLVVPEAVKAGRPCGWISGSMAAARIRPKDFIRDHERSGGQFIPRDTIVLHVYHRYCNPAASPVRPMSSRPRAGEEILSGR